MNINCRIDVSLQGFNEGESPRWSDGFNDYNRLRICNIELFKLSWQKLDARSWKENIHSGPLGFSFCSDVINVHV